MRRKKNKKRSKLGMAPGTPVFTGIQKMSEANISVIAFNEEEYKETNPKSIGEITQLFESLTKITWVNIDGLHDEKIVEDICQSLGVHKLTVEDILNVGQRPKVEEYNTYLHTVIKNIEIDPTDGSVDYEQISFILKGNILVSFQEKTADVLESVRARIREDKGTVRKKGADYLLYVLLDSVVDNYIKVLEDFGDRLEDLEIELLENPNKDTLGKLHLLRRETLDLRRSVFPIREMVSDLEKLENIFVSHNMRVFIRDLNDHTRQVTETIEIFRDTTSSLLDLYINSVSNRTNEIMKVLTIMTSIFIPLTFLSGVYGMNFENMPELRFKYGYFILLGVMLSVFVSMLIYLKRKKWI